jgi:hypothetical protein
MSTPYHVLERRVHAFNCTDLEAFIKYQLDTKPSNRHYQCPIKTEIRTPNTVLTPNVCA